MSGLLTGLMGFGGPLSSATSFASKTLEGAMSDSMTESAVAQAAKMKMDTQNSILDGKMDSATKEINSGHNAAKAIQF
ncbi:hypothetical protein [Pantoea stewartii]|uniref:hypothetical protein n=1 Tax=Pantoea stewartii TaxID=66269 RepID=UPI0039F57E98